MDVGPSAVSCVALEVKTILPNSKIHRAHRDTFAYPPDIPHPQTLEKHVRTIAMGATEIAFVGHTDAELKIAPVCGALYHPVPPIT
jgi:hypothetical protein